MYEVIIAVEVEDNIFKYIKCFELNDAIESCIILNKYYTGKRYQPLELINNGHIKDLKFNLNNCQRMSFFEDRNYTLNHKEFWQITSDYKLVYFKEIEEWQLRDNDNYLIDL